MEMAAGKTKNKMTTLTFHGGAGEIGGNKILLEDGKTRVFLDFGMSFKQANRFFDEFMQPRKLSGVSDLIEFGLLPNLECLYRCDYLEHCRCDPGKEPGFDGVLLSHGHMDHASYIHYLRQDIPVYCTQGSRDILQAFDDTGKTGTNELIDLKESFKTYINKKGEESRLKGDKTKIPRTYNMIDSKKFKVGPLEVEALPVSHSLLGATAYIIHTSAGPVVYTGDFRFHGYLGDLTKKFVEKAAEAEPVALLCEGTRIDSAEKDSEEEVRDKVCDIAEKTKKLVVVNFPVRDTDRMVSFLEAAKKCGRSLVINLKQAYVLDLFEKSGLDAPRLSDKNIRVYIPRKTWGIINDERYSRRIQLQDYDGWERDFLDHKHAVTAEEISKNQESYVYRCDFFELKELIDIRPEKGSAFIRSVCEPFDIEMKLDLEKAEEWLKHFGLYPYHQFHASGHLNHDEIREVIEEINPKTVYPIHTEHPEMFKEFHDNVVIPEKDGRFDM